MVEVKSSKPSVQRKWHYSRPLHMRGKDFASHLSKELRKELHRRSIELRKGDTVKVMRGDESYLGKQGKVTGFKALKRQVFVEGITRKKVSGKEIQIPFKASNLLAVAIDDKDPRRIKGRKAQKQEAGAEKKAAKAAVKEKVN
mgnify:CR=1 FL=1